MPTNDFLPFALDSGANVLAQADYSALTARSTGFTAGTARSAELNKVWRQAAFAVSSIAQFMADYTGSDVLDDGNSANFKALFTKAVALLSMGTDYAADTGAANTYVAAFTPAVTELVDGMVLRFKALNANTGASTFNPNGLGAKPIVGGAHAALQGGEIAPNGDVWLQYNSSIGGGSWIMIDSTGAALQVAPATQSQQATPLGQVLGAGATAISSPTRVVGTTYTNSTSRPLTVVIYAGSGNGNGTTGSGLILTVSGIIAGGLFGPINSGSSISGMITAIVPPGATYSLSNTGLGLAVVSKWTEY
jgi:hypothetical protein